MEVSRDLHHIKKRNVTPQELKEAFDRHMLIHYLETCVYKARLEIICKGLFYSYFVHFIPISFMQRKHFL